ncbi:MAG: hypothetical protein ACPGUZ_00405 [Holosporaceae bacterium]
MLNHALNARLCLKTFFIAAFACLAGCTTQTFDAKPGLQSLHKEPLPLNTGLIEVRLPPITAQSLSIDPEPGIMVSQWITDRFYAKGGKGKFIFVIEKATIIERPVALQKTGLFQDEEVCYEAIVVLKLLQETAQKKSSEGVRLTVKTRQIVANTLTLYQRKTLWVSLLEKTLDKLDDDLTHTMVLKNPLRLS